LVFGGCEKCASEIPIFEQLAAEYTRRVKFVRINKDDSPDACKSLGVAGCPAFVFLNKATRLHLSGKDVDKSELKVEESLKK
jgi:thioredoxin 1